MARAGSAVMGTLALALLVASCTSGEPAVSAGTAASPGALKALAAACLVIARPANRRLGTENDGFTDDEHGDMAAAESDLRADGLLSFTHRHQAAGAAVEAQVKVIRRDLGLPPPSGS
jgi:hypothetical protein